MERVEVDKAIIPDNYETLLTSYDLVNAVANRSIVYVGVGVTIVVTNQDLTLVRANKKFAEMVPLVTTDIL